MRFTPCTVHFMGVHCWCIDHNTTCCMCARSQNDCLENVLEFKDDGSEENLD